MVPKYETYFGQLTYPVDAVMPAAAQSAAEIVTAGLTLALLVWGLRNVLVRRDARLLILMLAGMIAVGMEVHAMNIWRFYYAPVGQNNLYVGLGRPVPVFLAFVYSLYFGLVAFLYLKFTDGSWSAARYWKIIVTITVIEAVMEIIFIHFDLWGYYDVQPFTLFGFPIHVAFSSACMCVLYGEIQRIWFANVTGIRQYQMLVFGPMILLGVLTAFVYPVYFAFESHQGLAATRLGSLLSMGLSAFASYTAVKALTRLNSGGRASQSV